MTCPMYYSHKKKTTGETPVAPVKSFARPKTISHAPEIIFLLGLVLGVRRQAGGAEFCRNARREHPARFFRSRGHRCGVWCFNAAWWNAMPLRFVFSDQFQEMMIEHVLDFIREHY